MIRSRLGAGAIGASLLTGAFFIHHSWLSSTLAKAQPPGSGAVSFPPGFTNFIYKENLDLPDHLLVSRQVDAHVRRHWPWMAPLCLVTCLGLAVILPGGRGRWMPRWRIRTALLGVALLALMLATLKLSGRSLAYQQRADYHACNEAYWRGLASESNETIDKVRGIIENSDRARKALLERRKQDLSAEAVARLEAEMIPEIQRSLAASWAGEESHIKSLTKRAKDNGAKADYHARLRPKYLRAASHPWESVSPDPPEYEY